MKLRLFLTLTVIVGLLSSCAEEQPTEQTPTAEKASLKTNIEETVATEETVELASTDDKDIAVAALNSSDENAEKSTSTTIRGSQNFDPNSDEKFYSKNTKKGTTAVKEKNSSDIDVDVNPSTGGVPQMTFDEKRYYFGTIEEGKKVTHSFNFVNTGTSDLIITNATASCGCTKPSFSFLPIKPNESSSIEVTFNSAGRDGMQSKSITITTNAYPKVRKVYLEGKIVPKGAVEEKDLQADPDQ